MADVQTQAASAYVDVPTLMYIYPQVGTRQLHQLMACHVVQ
jgi:hypothetical protein